MSLFKRIRATVTSQVDEMVSQIENHDAVIDATLKDARQKVAKSKVRLGAIQREVASLQRRREEQQTQAQQWAQRAVASRDDQPKALACLQRRKQCQQSQQQLSTMLEQVRGAEQQLRQDIQLAEAQVMQMNQQRQLMRARETAAESMKTLSTMEVGLSSELAQSFDRWDERITENELCVGIDRTADVDTLEAAFATDEEEVALLQELEQLVTQQAVEDNHHDSK